MPDPCRETRIGSNCFIVMNFIILNGAEIGDNCIIGAGSVVTGKIESNSVIGGNPAKIICALEKYKDKKLKNFDKSAMPIDDINSYDYCLDKVLECSQLIFIIGRRYGGPYRGEKYKDIADEIKKLNPRIGEPSISLMEFYLAKRSGLSTRVFTKKDIYNERSTYEKNRDNGNFKPAFVDDVRVFEIISTITRLETGNWFKTFMDLADLLEIIKIEFGNKFDK